MPAEILAGVAVEGNGAELAAIRAGPAAVVPRADHKVVQVIGVVPFKQLINFQRPVEILLVPPAAHIQIRHLGRADVWLERLFPPELVIVGMADEVVPGGQLAMEVAFIHVGERAQIQVPPIGVRAVELEIGIGFLGGFQKRGVLDSARVCRNAATTDPRGSRSSPTAKAARRR